ncbi:hypothetical protein E2C01_011726 [Portunus trituberculatus]|uniref:Uncharacterized protein n=1 Tax=Portunus trituberculatus TaxID=210409 RepID=A0A5B7DC22_PORTR|nr:hypothetical protein [Portunus trituberculatus]
MLGPHNTHALPRQPLNHPQRSPSLPATDVLPTTPSNRHANRPCIPQHGTGPRRVYGGQKVNGQSFHIF